MSVLVDAISNVVNAHLSDIQTTPDLHAFVEIQYITGLATSGENMIKLIDVDKGLEALSGNTDIYSYRQFIVEFSDEIHGATDEAKDMNIRTKSQNDMNEGEIELF